MAESFVALRPALQQQQKDNNKKPIVDFAQSLLQLWNISPVQSSVLL